MARGRQTCTSFFTRVLPLMQHALPVPFKLDDNQQRVDKTTAHTSLREAFANTLIHAVYTTMENVVIDRYPDRIVMSNPGSMLVSMEDFYAGNHSVCRNPLLQKMFIFIGVGEKAGSGADTIVKGWKDNGWTLPVIKEQVAPDRVTTTMMVSVTSADNVIENADKPLINQGTADKIVDKASEILDFINAFGIIKTADISKRFGLSMTQSRFYLQQLTEAGKIEPQGENKNRTYRIK